MKFDRILVRRIALRLVSAAAVVVAMLWLGGPPGNRTATLRAIPISPRVALWFVASVLAAALALEAGVRIVAWAKKRGPRSISEGGIVCFALGLVSGLCALNSYLVIVGLATALPGLLVGCLVLRAERRRDEGHSLLNLTGLGLNAANVLTVAAAWITALPLP